LQFCSSFQRALPREGKLPDWGGALLSASHRSLTVGPVPTKQRFRVLPSRPGIGTAGGVASKPAAS
jgi:hypothetical protein